MIGESMPLVERRGSGIDDLALETFKLVGAARRRGLTIDHVMTVSEWADRYRVLPPFSAEPGRWRTARLPYLREPMDCLSVSSPSSAS